MDNERTVYAMAIRNLYRESCIYEYAIVREIMQKNDSISIDTESRGYITGKTSYECVPKDEQALCDRIAVEVVKYLVGKEPSLKDKPMTADIIIMEPFKRNEDERTLIFTDEKGKEIGVLVKYYSHSVRHIRAMRPNAMMESMYYVKTDETELDIEFDKNPVTYEEIKKDKDAVYERYLSFAQRMNYYAYKLIPDAPKLLIQSLLGTTDYYCVDISDKQKSVRISVFNMNGTLNAACTPYPKELIEIQSGNYSTSAFKKNMLTMIFDGGWMVTMRLHLGAAQRADKPVLLKYDVSLKGMPYHIDDEIIPL